jgi:hypothetical protein
MYFAVDPDDVAAAAAPVGHLADAVANLDLGADLAPLALALPASTVASAVPELDDRWSLWVEALTEAATGQAGRLQRAGCAYAVVEASAHASLAAGRSPS